MHPTNYQHLRVCLDSRLAVFLDEVREVALAAVVPIEMHGHKDTRAAQLMGTFTAQPGNLVVGVNLVELEHGEFHLLTLMLDLLWLGVCLLFALLATTWHSQCQKHSRA